MKFRKFEVLSVELSPGGPGPERAYKIVYRAIKDKEWITGTMWSIGRNETEAKRNIEQRFGGKQ